ncbi:MAG: prepilin-type N-terminal cleavage/methylation domain-containing protein [Myxococcaceae bacterium]|nr:prepilin-type N-terminal cleavage/methylation domain-containing protein [Myxococcaceae bacterium]
MTRRRQHYGFTLIELMIVVAIIGILAAIAVPNFIRFQARARQAEVTTNLKSLFTGLRTQQRMPSPSIHASSFAPERGNRYSYHLDNGCAGGYEDRSTLDAMRTNTDDCIGTDQFKYPTFPGTFAPMPVAGATWDYKGTSHGMSVNAGIFGVPENWSFLAYAAGDVDNTVDDMADTWLISSSDAQLVSVCPFVGGPDNVAAGEPYNVVNDVNCD